MSGNDLPGLPGLPGLPVPNAAARGGLRAVRVDEFFKRFGEALQDHHKAVALNDSGGDELSRLIAACRSYALAKAGVRL